MPAPPPPGSKTSSTGTGEQTTEFTLGHGMFKILAASIVTTNAYAESGNIAYVYKTGMGTEIVVYLASGWASKYLPIILDRDVIVQGPGIIRATLFHLASTSHTFNAEYYKAQEFEGVVIK